MSRTGNKPLGRIATTAVAYLIIAGYAGLVVVGFVASAFAVGVLVFASLV